MVCWGSGTSHKSHVQFTMPMLSMQLRAPALTSASNMTCNLTTVPTEKQNNAQVGIQLDTQTANANFTPAAAGRRPPVFAFAPPPEFGSGKPPQPISTSSKKTDLAASGLLMRMEGEESRSNEGVCGGIPVSYLGVVINLLEATGSRDSMEKLHLYQQARVKRLSLPPHDPAPHQPYSC